MTVKALTLYPEHAEGFACGIRNIETRGWSTKYRGRLLIHAGMRDPDSAAARRSPQSKAILAAIPHGRGLTRGAIVASCELVDVVPMVDAEDYERRYDGSYEGSAALLITDRWLGLVPEWGGALDEDEVVTVDDQRPYGDFAPGRYAWLLDDIKPTTERCPWCRGRGSWPPLTRQVCRVCAARRGCDPIPAKGRQGLWSWEP